MEIETKAQIEKLIDEIDDHGEGKLVIIWERDGKIRYHKQFGGELLTDSSKSARME